jgi:hypothetical protein
MIQVTFIIGAYLGVFYILGAIGVMLAGKIGVRFVHLFVVLAIVGWVLMGRRFGKECGIGNGDLQVQVRQ